MKVLITGGAGFIGSNYVRHHLAQSDDQITILDALTYAGSRDTISDFIDNSRVKFVHGDICDRDTVNAVLKGMDAIVHFAAESHVDRSIAGSERFMVTNAVGTNVLCDLAKNSEIERFVHVSTDEVYGSREKGSFDENDRLNRAALPASKACRT